MRISYKWSWLTLTLLLVLIIINLVYLNYQWYLSGLKNEILPQNKSINITRISDKSFPTELEENKYLSIASSSVNMEPVFDQIRESTAALTQKVDTLSKAVYSGKSENFTNTLSHKVREYIIPLGSGSSSAGDWNDIIGIEAYIDPSNYGVIRQMYFEASLSIPTGNGRIYARLRNVTDNIGLVESEIFHEGNGGLVSSGKIPVPAKTKLYRVQLKSTLEAAALIESARIKIYVE